MISFFRVRMQQSPREARGRTATPPRHDGRLATTVAATPPRHDAQPHGGNRSPEKVGRQNKSVRSTNPKSLPVHGISMQAAMDYRAIRQAAEAKSARLQKILFSLKRTHEDVRHSQARTNARYAIPYFATPRHATPRHAMHACGPGG